MRRGGVAVEEPALVQQLDLPAVFSQIRFHQLMAKPLRQGNPSSGMLPVYLQPMKAAQERCGFPALQPKTPILAERLMRVLCFLFVPLLQLGLQRADLRKQGNQRVMALLDGGKSALQPVNVINP